MANVAVSVTFEADSKDEAERKILAWKLHEGCSVFWSITEQQAVPHMADAKGKLREHQPEPPIAPPPPTELEG